MVYTTTVISVVAVKARRDAALMVEEQCLTGLTRPKWELPDRIKAGLTIASLLVGILGYLLTIGLNLPEPLKLFSLVVACAPLIVAFYWIIVHLYRESRTCWKRFKCYEPLLNMNVDYAASLKDSRATHATSLEAEQVRVRDLARMLTSHARNPSSVRTYEYKILDSIIENKEVLVALDDQDRPTLEQGQVLSVFDPVDGKFLGNPVCRYFR